MFSAQHHHSLYINKSNHRITMNNMSTATTYMLPNTLKREKHLKKVHFADSEDEVYFIPPRSELEVHKLWWRAEERELLRIDILTGALKLHRSKNFSAMAVLDDEMIYPLDDSAIAGNSEGYNDDWESYGSNESLEF